MIMKVELDRKDIISLMKGTSPNYSVMHKIPKDLGSYVGGFCDRWDWNYSVPDEYTDEELFSIYMMCKHSWIKP